MKTVVTYNSHLEIGLAGHQVSQLQFCLLSLMQYAKSVTFSWMPELLSLCVAWLLPNHEPIKQHSINLKYLIDIKEEELIYIRQQKKFLSAFGSLRQLSLGL